MAKRDFENLVEKASKRAQSFGGVLEILLATKSRDLTRVSFDKKRSAFVLNGKQISIQVIRRQLDILDDKIGRIIVEYALKLQSGEWTLEKWKEEMVALMDESHLLFAALAIGSLAQAATNPTFLKRSGDDAKFLGRFALHIKQGRVPTAQMKIRRGKAYLNSTYITYGNIELDLHILSGYTEARRLLKAKESCKGCVEWAGRWMPIGKIPRLGTLDCTQFCKCVLEYR